ncbi:MAG TPA: Spy/CpxP family protein refolding chaperone [Methylibium sp.]|uniref:Spy/CpxP family protein refolding chaperone n=1 Tax=Methylibium sp. TaxID=2067992 RepID=UPI002DB6B741|nr:Spy/CpxP family protein refolding chaperone [Methylibium sp.]HEU4459768.1 Spy/CpxP family protein refolding chaperone [Methylibium sp.]
MNGLNLSLPRTRVFVMATLLALASAFSLSAWARPGHGGHEGGGFMMGSPRMLERVFDEVNATDAQRTQLRQIAQAARDDLKTIRQSGRELRERQLQLFSQPTVDANAAETLRQQMLAQHDQASRRMLQAMLDASRVLSPEQRAKLAEKMKARHDMMNRHMQERRQLETPKG